MNQAFIPAWGTLLPRGDNKVVCSNPKGQPTTLYMVADGVSDLSGHPTLSINIYRGIDIRRLLSYIIQML